MTKLQWSLTPNGEATANLYLILPFGDDGGVGWRLFYHDSSLATFRHFADAQAEAQRHFDQRFPDASDRGVIYIGQICYLEGIPIRIVGWRQKKDGHVTLDVVRHDRQGDDKKGGAA